MPTNPLQISTTTTKYLLSQRLNLIYKFSPQLTFRKVSQLLLTYCWPHQSKTALLPQTIPNSPPNLVFLPHIHTITARIFQTLLQILIRTNLIPIFIHQLKREIP